MFKKGTKLYSVIKGKCPRCQDGNFFKYGFTFYPNRIATLHERCSKCKLKYMIEPSFYFGAMYVSYALTVGLSIVIFLITKLIFHLTILQTFFAIAITLFLVSPLSLRLSRIIWINLFVSYQPDDYKELNNHPDNQKKTE